MLLNRYASTRIGPAAISSFRASLYPLANVVALQKSASFCTSSLISSHMSTPYCRISSIETFKAAKIMPISTQNKLGSRSFSSSQTSNVAASKFISEANIPERSRISGSYHWIFERALSISFLALFIMPFFIGHNPIVDFLIGIILPLHCHLGFSSTITDYLPKRKFGIINTVGMSIVYITTIGTMWACYEINTNDIGITSFVANIWKSL